MLDIGIIYIIFIGQSELNINTVIKIGVNHFNKKSMRNGLAQIS
jgi:hypothetical protein